MQHSSHSGIFTHLALAFALAAFAFTLAPFALSFATALATGAGFRCNPFFEAKVKILRTTCDPTHKKQGTHTGQSLARHKKAVNSAGRKIWVLVAAYARKIG